MPTSPSPRRSTKLLILVAVLAVVAVAVVALPASLVGHFLPSSVVAEDFSGSLWHGSAGRITVDSRDAGALEWHLHPAALLSMTLSADVHWVKTGFVLDATADIDRSGVRARAVRGGGPIEDLAALGVGSGWRGATAFTFSKLDLVFTQNAGAGRGATLRSAAGDITVADLILPQVGNGADLGGYSLHVIDSAAQLTDTGGPLEVNANIQLSAADRTGLLSGTVKERPDAPPALRSQLDNLTQLHARDAQGRIPVELEFTL